MTDSRPSRIRSVWRKLVLHLRRAFTWDLRGIPVTEREHAVLQQAGHTSEVLHRYAAWRRSTLLVIAIPTLLSALLSTIGIVEQTDEELGRLGRALQVLSTAILYALPVSALAAALCWTRLRLSQRVLATGWVVAFIPPILIAMVPQHWWLEPREKPAPASAEAVQQVAREALAGLYYFLMLLPTVLSILPGLIRASLRVKTLLPASVVTGWFLVAGAPFYMLLWLVALVAVNHFAGNLLLVLGIILLVSAPMLYVARADLFVRPLTAEQAGAIRGVRWLALGVSGLAGALLLAYLITKTILGLSLVGLDPERSVEWILHNADEPDVEELLQHATSWVWLGDLNLFDVVIEYVSRSLFTAAVFADLLVRMNVSVWFYERKFADSPAAADYNALMTEVSQILGPE